MAEDVKWDVEVKIEPGWREALKDEFEKPYFEELVKFVKAEYEKGTVYPPPKFILRAFWETPFDKVKVVILGQDPYHGPKEANGLSFAVDEEIRKPPSLLNIYKELKDDLGVTGNINRWPQQGVLLLNSTLTVRANSPASHQNKGWEQFTDAVIQILSDKKEHLVFILWGKYAKDKGKNIDKERHLVIESPHPSPFAARYGFFGSNPFSRTNEYLRKNGEMEIEW